MFPADDFQNCVLKMKNFRQLILLITVLSPAIAGFIGCGGTVASENMATRGDDHKLMDEAIETAKAKLDDFIAAIESGSGEKHAIKESITSGKKREYIWLTNVKYADGQFTGTVVNAPTMVKGIAMGDQRTVSRSKVVDWKYENEGEKFGNFTLGILIESVPENDRAEYEAELGG